MTTTMAVSTTPSPNMVRVIINSSAGALRISRIRLKIEISVSLKALRAVMPTSTSSKATAAATKSAAKTTIRMERGFSGAMARPKRRMELLRLERAHAEIRPSRWLR